MIAVFLSEMILMIFLLRMDLVFCGLRDGLPICDEAVLVIIV